MSDEEINNLDLLVIQGLCEDFSRDMGKFYAKTIKPISSVIESSSHTIQEVEGLNKTIEEVMALAEGLSKPRETSREEDKELLAMLSLVYQEGIKAYIEDIKMVQQFVVYFTKRFQELSKLHEEGNETT